MSTACLFAENKLTGLSEEIILDPVSKSLISLDLLHYLRHMGKFFQHNGKVTSLANNASFDHLIITPASATGVDIHMDPPSYRADGAPFESFLYEATTVSANGTAVTPLNLNRNSANISSLLVYHTPTVTGVGDQLNYSLISGTDAAGGGGEQEFPEIILRRDTIYLSRVTNKSGAVINLSYTLNWVEVPHAT